MGPLGAHHLDHHAIARRFVQPDVEARIEIDEPRQIARAHRRTTFRNDAPERGGLEILPLRQHRGHVAVDGGAKVVDFTDEVRIKRRHDRPATAVAVHEAVSLEHEQRLPDGRTGHAQPRGERLLPDAAARGE